MNREDYFKWKDFRESTNETLNNEEYELVCNYIPSYFCIPILNRAPAHLKLLYNGLKT